jgi:hypothetical protein
MDTGVHFLARKEKNVNFRTASHNALVQSDDQYDAKYHASALLHSKLWGLYSAVISSICAPTVQKLARSFRDYQTSKKTKSSRAFAVLSGFLQ